MAGASGDVRPFTYDPPANRVLFGVGAIARLPQELERLGIRRALLLCTPGQLRLAEQAAAALGERSAGIYSGAVMHVPREVADRAREVARARGADCCVAVGGGSTIGLGKAIALVSELPIIAVPTTYAGSEMTTIWGITESGAKRTGRDRRVLPRTVIYDPELTLGLPPRISGPSGMNALAHCIEALYAHDANPITSLMAEEGIRALAASLPRVVEAPDDLEGRSRALYGAWLAGASLGVVSMGLHHKLCHVLGGSFGLPHAETHTIMLPHTAAYNVAAAPDALRQAAAALGAEDAAGGLYDLAARLGAKLALRDLGMREGDLERAVELAMRDVYPNPAPLTPEGLRRLLADAYVGRRPAPG
jgi:maleylacetate reductase